MEWAHHVACVESSYKVSVGKDEGKRTFGEASKCRRMINVCKQIGCLGVDLIQLAVVGSSGGFPEYE